MDPSFFTYADLLSDYRRALAVGVSFGLYAVPHICDDGAGRDEGQSHHDRMVHNVTENENIRARLRGVMDELIREGVL